MGHGLQPDGICGEPAPGGAGHGGGGRGPCLCGGSGPEGPVLYSVSQEDGPWGKRYLLRQVPSYILWAREDGSIFIYDIASVEDPLVFSASVPLEALYDGMEVRLR